MLNESVAGSRPVSYTHLVRSDPTFTVLEDCGCPAVLVEEGFITNASDRAALCTDSACEQAAELYYQCIIDFFE